MAPKNRKVLPNKMEASGHPITRRSTLKGGFAFGASLATGVFGIRKASAAPITMRFGSDSPIGAPHTKSAVALKELVESRTSGRVEVTIFPDSQLGNNNAMTNAVKAGTLDGVVSDVSYFSAAVPEADVFNLPFVFKNTQQELQFANGQVGAEMKPKMEEAFACEVLGFATDGSRNMWNSVRPIRTPADIVGLKMAVQPSKIQRDTVLAFGGIPTVLSMKEMYTALQTGLIDGSDKSMADIADFKLYQVTKYLTLTSHYSIVSLMIVSKKFMAKLSPQDQAILRESAKPAVEAQVKAVLSGEGETIALVKEKGMQVLQMENPKAFAAKLESVYKDASDRIGADIIKKARGLA